MFSKPKSEDKHIYHEKYAFLPNTYGLQKSWDDEGKHENAFNATWFSSIFGEEIFDERAKFCKCETPEACLELLKAIISSHNLLSKALIENNISIDTVINKLNDDNDFKHIFEFLKAHSSTSNEWIELANDKMIKTIQNELSLNRKYDLSDRQHEYCELCLKYTNDLVAKLKKNELSDLYALSDLALIARKEIAAKLKQDDQFGVKRNADIANSESAPVTITTLLHPEQTTRFADQLTTIYKFLKENDKTFNNGPTKFGHFYTEGLYKHKDIPNSFDMLISKIDIYSNKASFCIIHPDRSKIEEILKPLSTIKLDELIDQSKTSHVDFFFTLGKIYHILTNACQAFRGSASAAQIQICAIMKARYPDRPLIPFSNSLGINPDILAFILPVEKFANSFTECFDKNLFEKYYPECKESLCEPVVKPKTGF